MRGGRPLNERNAYPFKARLTHRGTANFSRIVLVLLGILAFASIPDSASASGPQVGKASWYGPGFHGKKTASGQIFNQNRLTAAHPRLPLGSRARVTNLQNGRAVEVTINDRGPHGRGRIIDLSRAAAKQLAMVGTTRVRIVALSP